MDRQLRVIVITGANSGLGAEIADAIRASEDSADAFVLEVCGMDCDFDATREDAIQADLTDPNDSLRVSNWVKEQTEWFFKTPGEFEEPYDSIYPILVNCAGVNYIEWFDHADMNQFDRLMAINVKAGLMLTQNLIGLKPPFGGIESKDWFNGTGAILNIVSNASHVPMTNSAFYNASKGAFHIATLSLARELRKTHGICVFGISPNKLAGTGMSDYIEGRVPALRGWTPEEAAKYQLSALPAGEETDPSVLADFIAYLLAEPIRHKYLTGTIIPYGA